MLYPGILARFPSEPGSFTTPTIMCARVFAAVDEMTRRVSGTNGVVMPVLGLMIALTAWGCTQTPPLATAFTAASISTGVVTSPCPKDASADRRSFHDDSGASGLLTS